MIEKDRLKKIVSQSPVDYLEIRLEENKSNSVNYVGKQLEDIGTNESKGGCIRACHKGGWGFSSFNLPKDLDVALNEAINQAKLLSKNEETKILNAPSVDEVYIYKNGTDPFNIELETKKEITDKYNAMIINNKNIVSSRTVYLDRNKKTTFVSSNDVSIEKEQTFTGITFAAVARDGTNIQRGYHSIGDHRGFENVLNKEDEVQKVIKRAIDLLGASKIEGKRYDVILDPKLTGVFTHEAFGHMSEADFIFDNPEFAKKMEIGRKYGPDFLNIIDDGSLLGECGGYKYDDEGVESKKTYLIKNGIINGHLHSLETASQMSGELTGNARAISYRYKPIVRMSCTYMQPGTTSFEEMVKNVDDGIYAVGMLGGNTDLEQFTFSAEYAYQIKKGKIGHLLRDVILTGNLFETLHNIHMVGNDLKLFGGMGGCGKDGQSPLPVSDGGPHIMIKDVLVG